MKLKEENTVIQSDFQVQLHWVLTPQILGWLRLEQSHVCGAWEQIQKQLPQTGLLLSSITVKESADRILNYYETPDINF